MHIYFCNYVTVVQMVAHLAVMPRDPGLINVFLRNKEKKLRAITRLAADNDVSQKVVSSNPDVRK